MDMGSLEDLPCKRDFYKRIIVRAKRSATRLILSCLYAILLRTIRLLFALQIVEKQEHNIFTTTTKIFNRNTSFVLNLHF